MVMDLVGSGGLAVLGNHDNAVRDPRENLNIEAQVAMEWTRGELGLAERRFLEELPLRLKTADVFMSMPTRAIRSAGAM